MARIRTIPDADADGELGDLYDGFGRRAGQTVPHILKLQSLSPSTLRTHYQFYRSLMFGQGPLSRTQRELLAVAVSQTNACAY